MKKDKLNTNLREFARTLSPTSKEREMIGDIYDSFTALLGGDRTIQIGSYPRFTAITPVHDLDVLYILGDWNEKESNPTQTMNELYKEIINNYKMPKEFDFINVSVQSHSVTVAYIKDDQEIFSTDVVPAFKCGKNEFAEDKYKVPEILKKKSHVARVEFYAQRKVNGQSIDWIDSDPRGYIKAAALVGENIDFRKAVKVVKKWRNNLCDSDDGLKLKSFHLEQVMTRYFQCNKNMEIFDAIFQFFVDLPDRVLVPNQIPDKANPDKFIDDYVGEFTQMQVAKIKRARDGFLIRLEKLKETDPTADLLKVDFYERSRSERFLFDLRIPTFLEDDYQFDIYGEVQERQGGFRKYILDRLGIIDVDRRISFRIKQIPSNVDLFKWKVKNDNQCGEPRGEITDHKTRYDPESTKYKGNHCVECFAIRNGICVAMAKQNVVLR